MQPAHFMPFLFYLKVLKGKGVQRWLPEQINKKNISMNYYETTKTLRS